MGLGLGMYVLFGTQPIEIEDSIEWADFMEHVNRVVARTGIVAGVTVSTVFLGLDHSFGVGGRPLLFESLVFGGQKDGWMERYSTWEEAEAGHAQMVKEVMVIERTAADQYKRGLGEEGS